MERPAHLHPVDTEQVGDVPGGRAPVLARTEDVVQDDEDRGRARMISEGGLADGGEQRGGGRRVAVRLAVPSGGRPRNVGPWGESGWHG
jgi:hypothetical protein